MTSLLLDLRHAVRVLVRNPGVSVIAIFTLALAIGATTAVFSVVDGVLLRPLPYPAPDRLIAVWEVNDRGTYSRLADPNFDDFRDRNRTFSAMARYGAGVVSVAGAGEPTRETMATATRDFFNVLRVQPSLGRSFSADDARLGAAPAIIVSHRYWARSLGSTASLSNFHLRIQGRVYQVVGVMPAGFQFPADADLWVPAELDAANTSRTSHSARAIGRLRDGVSVAQATADLSAIARDIVRQSPEQGRLPLDRRGGRAAAHLAHRSRRVDVVYPPRRGLLPSARGLRERHEPAARPGRRASARDRHSPRDRCGTRAAGSAVRDGGPGAPHGERLDGPADCLARHDRVDLARPGQSAAARRRLDEPRGAGIRVGLSALVAIALGLVTAARGARRDPRAILVRRARPGWRGESACRTDHRRGTGGDHGRAAHRRGAARPQPPARAVGRSGIQDRGTRRDGSRDALLRRIRRAKARLSPFYADVFERLRAIPGVDEVAAASAVPMDGGLPDGLFADDRAAETHRRRGTTFGMLFQQKDKLGTADYCAVSPAYFRALGIPLVRGRVFDERDGPAAPHVAVISESLARSQWPGADPIGRTIEFGNMDGDLRPLTIVGIVGDTREYGPEAAAAPNDVRQRAAAAAVFGDGGDPIGR